jgi:two-component system phosphate regulon response regulator PhoB
VLAIVELSGRASAAAARIRKHGDSITIVFEPRDWSRVKLLAGEAPATDRSPEARGAKRSETTLGGARGAKPFERERKSSQPPRSVMKKLGDAGGARILLVDDDVEVREVVTAMLEAVGFAITAARSGEDGLGILERERFDLVVLDWTLPGMSGLELCRAVRARWAKLPVLFLTANAGTRDVVEAFAGGADDYVVKPFRAPELGARIFGLLRRATAP